MLDFSKMKKVADDLYSPGKAEDWFKRDSLLIRYHLGVYDLDEELRILNRVVMNYLVSERFTDHACAEEKKDNKALPLLINDLTEIINYIRRTQSIYEETVKDAELVTCVCS